MQDKKKKIRKKRITNSVSGKTNHLVEKNIKVPNGSVKLMKCKNALCNNKISDKVVMTSVFRNEEQEQLFERCARASMSTKVRLEW